MSIRVGDINFWFSLTTICIVVLAVLILIYEITQPPLVVKLHGLGRSDIAYVKCDYGMDINVTYRTEAAIRDEKTIRMSIPHALMVLQDPKEKCSIL